MDYYFKKSELIYFKFNIDQLNDKGLLKEQTNNVMKYDNWFGYGVKFKLY